SGALPGISTLKGQPIVYNSPTDIGGYFREVIEQGALDGANLKDVPLLVNHNEQMIPVARSRNNTPNSTMRLLITEKGLEMEADIDTERNMTARELDSAVERGDLDGMSFKFTVDDERWEGLETDYPTRHILKLGYIAEVSAVTFPAYQATSIEQLRDCKNALDNARAALESARSQHPETLDSGLDLLKAKAEFISKF
ncbi:MAG: HK97 family phage prohead protease, partial [Ruminococcus sp.]|nr:HK97 family phage prohead protease [Ruminococcus sp.]